MSDVYDDDMLDSHESFNDEVEYDWLEDHFPCGCCACCGCLCEDDDGECD